MGIPPANSGDRRVLRRLFFALALLLLVPLVAWCGLALWFDGPDSRPAAAALIVFFLLLVGVAGALIRPLERALLAIVIAVLAVVAWWNLIPPSNNRDWRPEVARLPRAHFEGSRFTIENVRNFDYTTPEEFTENWETREYDLDAIEAFDLFLSTWGSDLIAHTIASWQFSDGRHLAISIETRKEEGEAYSAVKGFFRQFELYYVVADERDVVRLRTNYRGETVYVYRIQRDVENARALLVEYLEEINSLAEKPRWYNAAFHNCTTSIRENNKHVAQIEPWDWRILLNGRIDEWGYERGMIDTSLPFEEMKKRSNITERAKAAGDSSDFSQQIRKGIPGMD